MQEKETAKSAEKARGSRGYKKLSTRVPLAGKGIIGIITVL